MKHLVIAAAAFAMGAGAANAASTGFILGQGNLGDVYRISTSDASISLFKDLADVGVGIEPNSPNGLGVNPRAPDDIFRTDYNNASTDNTLFRNDTALISGIPDARLSIASGHVEGDTFYYVDRSGMFVSISDIFGAPGAQTVTEIVALPELEATFGDIAFKDDLVYFSANSDAPGAVGNIFGSFSLVDPLGTFMSVAADDLYAGIAFDGDRLFGFNAKPDDLSNQLFEISIAAGTFGMATFIGDIVLAGEMLTDAAPNPVPLPSAALMLIGGLAGMGALRRRARKAAEA